MTQLDSLEGYYFEADDNTTVEVHNRFEATDEICCHLDEKKVEYCGNPAEWVFETSYNGEETEIAVCSVHCNI